MSSLLRKWSKEHSLCYQEKTVPDTMPKSSNELTSTRKEWKMVLTRSNSSAKSIKVQWDWSLQQLHQLHWGGRSMGSTLEVLWDPGSQESVPTPKGWIQGEFIQPPTQMGDRGMNMGTALHEKWEFSLPAWSCYCRHLRQEAQPSWWEKIEAPRIREAMQDPRCIIRQANQAKLHSFRMKPVYQYCYLVPRNH